MGALSLKGEVMSKAIENLLKAQTFAMSIRRIAHYSHSRIGYGRGPFDQFILEFVGW